jgi:trigger factor
MNITKENIDNLNAVLRVKIEKNDYEESVKNVLSDYRKKAQINGFRPGKVPFGLIKKMYGKQARANEVNKLVSESIAKYLDEENIHILGEPMIKEEQQPTIDWENEEDFEFVFDLGLSPDINIDFNSKIKVPYYTIKVDDKQIDEFIEEYARRFGQFIETDEIKGEEIIKGDIRELNENKEPKEEGVKAEDVTIGMNVIKDDDIKELFKGTKANETLQFNLKKAYPNDTEIGSLLNIPKEQVSELSDEFSFTIKEIKSFQPAEINQELFDNVYGEGNVKSIEEFREKVAEDIKHYNKQQSEYKMHMDIKNKLLKKADIDLPSEFLKRWILSTNKNITKEKIDEDFSKYEDDLKWQVVKNNIEREHDIQVTKEEIEEFAKKYALMQLQQYGISNLPDEQLQNFVNEMLSKEDERKRIIDSKRDEKIMEFLKEKLTFDEKKISKDEFNKMLEKQQ